MEQTSTEAKPADHRGELDFSGRTVVVTGSSRNIGRAIVLEFAGRGANVVINTRSKEDEARAVEEEARNLGAEALVVMGNAGDRSTIEQIKRAAEERFGRVDISISNAARRFLKDFDETTDDDWHYYLNQQLTASWYLAKAFVPGMRTAGWGRLIHVNGPDGWVGGPDRAPHSAAKAGLRNLTKSLARSLGPSGITVNDVVPGFQDSVRDPVTHPQLTPEHTAEAINKRIPIRRLPTMVELAWACAFLCSTRSDGITGTAIHVDGGQFVLS
jgi:NAD(P)-dependent dehydrogenase (short-subunit alcohol dehydrogenase family)